MKILSHILKNILCAIPLISDQSWVRNLNLQTAIHLLYRAKYQWYYIFPPIAISLISLVFTYADECRTNKFGFIEPWLNYWQLHWSLASWGQWVSPAWTTFMKLKKKKKNNNNINSNKNHEISRIRIRLRVEDIAGRGKIKNKSECECECADNDN